jgi:hypothetical protein
MAVKHGAPATVAQGDGTLGRLYDVGEDTVARTRSAATAAGLPVRNSSTNPATSSPASSHGNKVTDCSIGSSTSFAPSMPSAS